MCQNVKPSCILLWQGMMTAAVATGILKRAKLYLMKKKHSDRCKHCGLAEPKNFSPPQTPFPVAWDGQNLISSRLSLPLPTNPVWRVLMHAISSYHGNRSANTPTRKHTQTHRQDRLQYTAPQLAPSVIIKNYMTCKVPQLEHRHQCTNM